MSVRKHVSKSTTNVAYRPGGIPLVSYTHSPTEYKYLHVAIKHLIKDPSQPVVIPAFLKDAVWLADIGTRGYNNSKAKV